MIKHYIFILLVAATIHTHAQNFGEEGISDTIPLNFGLFEDDEILKLSLRFDIKNYTRKKPKEEYMKATLLYHISDTNTIKKDLKLKSRGNFRNEYCAFPPIKLNFKKTEFIYDDISDIKTMKMVTHCNDHHFSNEYIFKEYLAYKIYNLISDYSFRVRLVQVNYINTGKRDKSSIRYGFFIEPLKVMANRLNIINTELETVEQKDIQEDILDKVAVFNYMIGNTDWRVLKQHNIKIFTPSEAKPAPNGIIIPYDFDYSGFVNANYASPQEELNLYSVTERQYLGLCRDEEIVKSTLQSFYEKKDEIYEMINTFEFLNDKAKKQTFRFLDPFFDGIENKNRVLKDIKSECYILNQ